MFIFYGDKLKILRENLCFWCLRVFTSEKLQISEFIRWRIDPHEQY